MDSFFRFSRKFCLQCCLVLLVFLFVSPTIAGPTKRFETHLGELVFSSAGGEIVDDNFGNVYAAYIEGVSSLPKRLRLVKYAPNGAQLWEIYDATYFYDVLTARLLIGPNDDLYLCFFSDLDNSYVIQKRSPADGSLVWTYLIPTATEVRMGADGNIYIVRSITSPAQTILVKISGKNAALLWSNSVAVANPRKFAVGISGESALVYGTSSWTIRKFSSSGALDWTVTSNADAGFSMIAPGAATVDNQGNVYVLSQRHASSGDMPRKVPFVRKFATSNGSLEWQFLLIPLFEGSLSSLGSVFPTSNNSVTVATRVVNSISTDGTCVAQINSVTGTQNWRRDLVAPSGSPSVLMYQGIIEAASVFLISDESTRKERVVRLSESSGTVEWWALEPSTEPSPFAIASSIVVHGNNTTTFGRGPTNNVAESIKASATFFKFNSATGEFLSRHRTFYECPSNDYPICAVDSKDGGHFALRSDSPEGLSSDKFRLSRIGSNGQVIWETSLVSSMMYGKESLLCLQDGNVALVGDRSEGANEFLVCTRYSAVTGEQQSESKFQLLTGVADYPLLGVRECGGGGIVAAVAYGNAGFICARWDAGPTQTWGGLYTISGPTLTIPRKLTALGPNKFAVVGTTVFPVSVNKFFAMRINATTGATEWVDGSIAATTGASTSFSTCNYDDVARVCLIGSVSGQIHTSMINVAKGTIPWQTLGVGPGASQSCMLANGDFVSSRFVTNATQDIEVTRRSGTNGAVLWTRVFDSPGSGKDTSVLIFADKFGNIYHVGRREFGSGLTSTFSTFITKLLGSNGTVRWTYLYSPFSDANAEVESGGVSFDGSISFFGYYYNGQDALGDANLVRIDQINPDMPLSELGTIPSLGTSNPKSGG